MSSRRSWHSILDHVDHLLCPHTEPHFACVTNPERQLLSPISGTTGLLRIPVWLQILFVVYIIFLPGGKSCEAQYGKEISVWTGSFFTLRAWISTFGPMAS